MMKQKLLSLLALTFCWASSTWALDQVGGVYQIVSAQDLRDFATLVNGGTTGANAVLTGDINMSTLSSWTAIGDWNTGAVTSAYCGHFDGQGYTISNFNFTSNKNYFGIFGVISTGCLIENLIVRGTITSNVATSGVVGYARDATPTIRNVHSYLNINNTRAGSRLGGILGSSVNGTIIVDRCTYSGTMDGNDSGKDGNYGGIVGYTNNNSNAHLRVTNCLFDGELKNTAATPGNCTFGGMVGYVGANPDIIIENCLSIGKLQSKITGLFYGAVKHNTCSIVNSYYQKQDDAYTINGSASTVTPTTQQVTEVTDVQLSSGEIAFALNGDQTIINWFQTLSGDDYPTPNGTDVVYQTGRKHCDGTSYPDISYSNTDLGIVTDAHDYVDGFCSYCGILKEDYMTPVSGYYEIGTPAELKWFAAYVNAGHPDINAKLTDDINMASVAWTPIGNESVNYTGIFDGQSNAITNFSYTATAQFAGLFGYITTATIKDFSISGTLTSAYNYTGMIAYAKAAKVSGIHSSLNVTATAHTWVGGVVAGANGAIEIADCTFDGTLSTTGGNAVAGIMGYANTGTIRNCLFSGTLTGSGTVDHLGGILGYVANSGFGGVENCLSTGTITTTSGGTITSGAYLIGNVNSNTNLTNIKNNYFLQRDGNISGFAGALAGSAETPHAVTTEQLASGEVCYALNGDQSDIAFYQTKGTDDIPTLDSTHGQIYVNGTVCPDTGTPQGSVIYSNSEGTSVGSHDFVDGFCSFCEYFNPSFFSPVDGYYQIANGTQLKWFATKVNSGTYSANAKLTAAIDLTGVAWTPIGIGSGSGNPGATAYIGIFDGQGNSITGFEAEGIGHVGLFGDTDGATIKDFSISGNLTLAVTGGYGGGVVAWPINSTIENVHSALVIDVTNSLIHHVGGVVGSSRGSNTINRCSFNGSMTVAAGSTDNFGGVVGYITANDVVENCANYGSISFADTGCGAGGVVGYLNDNSASIKNCLNTGTVHYEGEGSPKYGGAIVGRLRTHTAAKVTNHYWLTGSGYGAGKDNSGNINLTSAIEADATLLASGEVAYKLNSDPSDIKWYQTIGTNAYPTLSSASEQVRYVGTAGYTTFYDATNDWELLGDAHAYIGTLNGSALHLDEINDIPHGNAVVIGGTYYNKVSTAATADTDGNVLRGSDGTVNGDGVNIYALANGANGVGFYPVGDGVTIPAGKAYLVYSGSSPVKGFTFVFDDDPDAIVSPLGETEEGAAVFNLAGQRISKMQKGINIMNGKKVLR